MKISEYPNATGTSNTDTTVIVQSGATKKITMAILKAFFGAGKMDTVTPTATNDVLMASGSPLAWVKKTLAQLKTALGLPESKFMQVIVVASNTDVTADTAIGGDIEIPANVTIEAVGAYSSTAGTDSGSPALPMEIDINVDGVSILDANVISIASGSKTSRNNSPQPIISDANHTAGQILTFDVDYAQTTPAKGLVVWIKYK